MSQKAILQYVYRMHGSINIWELFSGVAIFLLGMSFLENSLHQLTGRTFKLFLKKQTATKPRAILSGTIITGVLQSSSVVNLMLLAFVGANVISMQHALAVILGSNLGSTATSWIILSIGFNASIEQITFPLIGLGGILMSITNKESNIYQWSKFCLGLGFLFLGLDYIKSGMEAAVKLVDLASLIHYPAVVFLLTGFIITTLIQSSSATMVIALSAIHVNALNLYEASAIVLGSEIGTTIKFLLASIKGPAAKKRVALGNFGYNVINALLILLFLHAVNHFITTVMGIKDKLFALVFFQTLVNVIGIILFYPLLKPYGRLLEKLSRNKEDDTVFIHKVNIKDSGPALNALENELRNFIFHCILFTRETFEIPDTGFLKNHFRNTYRHGNLANHYLLLKQIHGEIHEYALQLQAVPGNDKNISQRLNQLITSNRNTMYTAKTIKDLFGDVTQLRNSSNDVKYAFYQNGAEETNRFCKSITSVMMDEDPQSSFKALCEIYHSVSTGYTVNMQQLYTGNINVQLSKIEISTLINFNREMYTAYKSFVFAVKDYALDIKEANYFDELPGFIR